MNLPIYQQIHIKNADLVQVSEQLYEDMNLHRPVVFVLSSLSIDEQREVIGILNNWFDTHQASWRYPYPVYIISTLTAAVSLIPVVSQLSDLPKFFHSKETKITVKESQILDRNRLLQQEIKNSDPHQMTQVMNEYGIDHKKIWFLVNESSFYEHLWTKLNAKRRSNG
jgi:hypothetical protein